jgi:N-acetylmuramoyl-L-alanine amidase
MTRFYLSFVLLLFTIIGDAQTFITTQDINVRKGAGSKYACLGVIPSGSSVEVQETKGKWGKITFEGNEGYISTKFLQAKTAESISNVTSTSSGSSNLTKCVDYRFYNYCFNNFQK